MRPSAITAANSRKLNILPQRSVPLEQLENILKLIQTDPEEVDVLINCA